jgi:hypothetical protein
MVLNDSEMILKEILPRKSFFFSMTEKIRIVFSFFYLVVSLIFIFSKSAILIFGILMFCVGLYLAIFRWLLRYFDLKNNYYIITNQRIIIAEKSTNDIQKEIKFTEIDQVNVEMNTNFFGNIIFGEPENIFGKNDEPFSFFKKSGMNFDEDKYVFLSVENINEILAVFKEMGLKVNKTFY